MSNIKRFSRLVERYLNEYKKDVIEEFYGVGTKVKVHSISYTSSSSKTLVILECIIILGDIINEDLLDRKMLDYLIKDASEIFFPDCFVQAMIRWD